ncbi:MAG TPA: cupin domain-containing protein [Thermoleophilia bacterium]|nr:cupin domain-containing protein [Thermoleophilia bacterium]
MPPVNVFTVPTEVDPGDPPGYRAAAVKLAPLIGAAGMGASVYDLDPGESICPYHFEFGCEEWLLVLTGRPTLRREGGDGAIEEELEPGAVVCFPPGPGGAHKVMNHGDTPLRVLMFSTTPPNDVDVSYYPDSDKYGVWPGHGVKGFLVRRGSEVDYYDGE